MFELLFWTGMRSWELLALTLNDFDFETKTVSISKNFTRLNGKDLILTPKNKRTITLPDFICDMVQDYVTHLYDHKPKERLFPVTKSYLDHEMRRKCQKSGVKRIRVHDIRHSHASLLIEQFFPLCLSLKDWGMRRYQPHCKLIPTCTQISITL